MRKTCVFRYNWTIPKYIMNHIKACNAIQHMMVDGDRTMYGRFDTVGSNQRIMKTNQRRVVERHDAVRADLKGMKSMVEVLVDITKKSHAIARSAYELVIAEKQQCCPISS